MKIMGEEFKSEEERKAAEAFNASQKQEKLKKQKSCQNHRNFLV